MHADIETWGLLYLQEIIGRVSCNDSIRTARYLRQPAASGVGKMRFGCNTGGRQEAAFQTAELAEPIDRPLLNRH